jgi:NADP-dependent 3-hydroxy acid dehydrogenase YdfG
MEKALSVTPPLESQMVAVVYASSREGWGIARRLIGADATVFAATRRFELLDAIMAEAGVGRAVPCDLVAEDAGDRYGRHR